VKNVIPVVLALGLVFATARAQEKVEKAEEGKKKGFHATLCSLLSPLEEEVKPNPRTSGANLVVPFQKAAGVEFGCTMDRVVAVWGRPKTISQRESVGEIVTRLWYRGLDFSFRGNSLFQVRLTRLLLPRMRFSSGITFEWTRAKLLGALGDPAVERENRLVYRSGAGAMEFSFFKYSGSRAKTLSSVLLTRAEAK
jgi:hypothetical protein